ncbi:MAG: chromate efflux transporter [Verrucomicrobia bacterium]|nr:chromate efflux transporter [Verrucomicrobiota bacterium]
MSEPLAQHPTFREAFRFWLKLGFISFGGPTGQIAIMHTELVEKRRWISEARFLHALNFCMLLPGPEATQLATYIGWLLHRTLGGIVAGVLFILPSALILWALSWIYISYGNLPWISAVFYGLKPAVLAIVAAAVIRIGKRALKNEWMWMIAGASFVTLFWLNAPFPLIIASAAAIGLAGGRWWPERFNCQPAHENTAKTSAVIDDSANSAVHTLPSWKRSLRVLVTCLALWWIPVLLLALSLGDSHTLVRQGIFFSKAAMVTFGGAYAVLPYVSQQAVEHHQWLTAHQMLDGLGLAETTPGPLIMVLQFVGFVGGWQHPGTLPSLLAATLGAAITTWATFVPCFLWIFLGAPHIEQMRRNTLVTSALSAVTAAVVGVILNLAVWFGIHVLVPNRDSFDWIAASICAVALGGMLKWKWGVIPVIAGAGACGLIVRMLTPV